MQQIKKNMNSNLNVRFLCVYLYAVMLASFWRKGKRSIEPEGPIFSRRTKASVEIGVRVLGSHFFPNSLGTCSSYRRSILSVNLCQNIDSCHCQSRM